MASEANSAVRAARRSDLHALADLRMRFLGAVGHAEPRLRLLADARARTEQTLPVWMGQDDRVLIVAEGEAPDVEEGTPPIVGYAMGLFTTAPPLLQHTHVGEILEIYVLPDARGRGLAGALIDVLTSALTGRGAEVLRSVVPIVGNADVDRIQRAGYSPLQFVLERRLDTV
ncbi:MAG: GNAT family N-acetyltransferase [Planctomycetota bacterium]|nr:GNAT family N-acetyltransferase [Planctomycetota bacterium]